MKNRKKVLILYNYILHYRVPFFNELAKDCDLTVLHSGDYLKSESDTFSIVRVPVSKIGPFFLQKGVIDEVRKDYDIIVSLFDIRWLATLAYLTFFKKIGVKHILWGAWLTNNGIANLMRLFYMKHSNANIFYTYSACSDFISLGLLQNKSYVANNTFKVEKGFEAFKSEHKNVILNVGSLNSRKKNDLLLKAFSEIHEDLPSDSKLIFIGDGQEKNILSQAAIDLEIDKKVEFIPEIQNPEELFRFYEKAVVSVSYGQAGLSVLQSMGFGVPFLTHKDAISGGELTNIKHLENGLFVEEEEELKTLLVSLFSDVGWARKLGQNAYSYYHKYCTISNMAAGFLDAFESTRTAFVDKRK